MPVRPNGTRRSVVASPSRNTVASENAGIAAHVKSSRIRSPRIDATSNPGTTMTTNAPTYARNTSDSMTECEPPAARATHAGSGPDGITRVRMRHASRWIASM